MFRFDTCQFCGNKGEQMYRRLLSDHNSIVDNNLWKRTCSKCNKTTAIVKRDVHKESKPKMGRPKKVKNASVEDHSDYYIIKYNSN